MRHTAMRRALVGFGALAIAVGTVSVSTTTATAQGSVLPDLAITAEFDRAAYESDDVIGVTVTVTNVSGTPVSHAWAEPDWPSTLWLDQTHWGELDRSNPPAELAPGASRSVRLTGTAAEPASGAVTFRARAFGYLDGNLDNNQVGITAPLTQVYGDFGGQIIHDRNGNGAPDTDEGIGGVRVSLSPDAHWGQPAQATTDQHGRFLFEDLPAGRYHAYYESADGWVVGPEEYEQNLWVVDDDAPVLDAVVLAVRPLSDTLHVTMDFDRAAYQDGETAHVTVTIRNRGRTDVTGIQAGCNRVGNANQLIGNGPGWGDLAYDRPGVTVPAGRTRTFHVYEDVPVGSVDWGYVAVACDFGPRAEYAPRGTPTARDWAAVPGATADTSLRLVYDRNGDGMVEDDGIANTRLTLLDAHTRRTVAHGTTDATGHAAFTAVPAGLYELWVPRWQTDGLLFQVWAPSTHGFVFSLEPRRGGDDD